MIAGAQPYSTDSRLPDRVAAALSRSVVNVGAGAGSDEPSDRYVSANGRAHRARQSGRDEPPELAQALDDGDDFVRAGAAAVCPSCDLLGDGEPACRRDKVPRVP